MLHYMLFFGKMLDILYLLTHLYIISLKDLLHFGLP